MIDVKLRGKNSLQFSFVTKLANTIDNLYPIYDSKVAIIFGFRSPPSSTELEKRISNFLAFYDELIQATDWLITQEKIQQVFQRMDDQFGEMSRQINPRKRLDFMLWSVGRAIDVQKRNEKKIEAWKK